MEDYAPILWLLFIVVSMGFSALSKARKRAARRAEEVEEGQERNAGQGHPTIPRYPTPGSGLPEGFPLPQQRSRRRPLRPRPEAQNPLRNRPLHNGRPHNRPLRRGRRRRQQHLPNTDCSTRAKASNAGTAAYRPPSRRLWRQCAKRSPYGCRKRRRRPMR